MPEDKEALDGWVMLRGRRIISGSTAGALVLAFICLKIVDFPDSPAPSSSSLIFSCSFWKAAAFAASTSFVCRRSFVRRQNS